MMECPECKALMKKVLDKTIYHPTGASGGGVWTFRTFDLHRCIVCGEYFHDGGEIVRSTPLKEA